MLRLGEEKRSREEEDPTEKRKENKKQYALQLGEEKRGRVGRRGRSKSYLGEGVDWVAESLMGADWVLRLREGLQKPLWEPIGSCDCDCETRFDCRDLTGLEGVHCYEAQTRTRDGKGLGARLPCYSARYVRFAIALKCK